ncbi:MAG: helix-turn-helix domain-containing protein [Pseudonocardiaceae bacterium]
MPRPNPPRSLQSEENLARRIAYERDRRGWTYEGIAKRLADAGCPIQGSAIYKIEKGNPRRRISVDELVALTKVFDVDADNLLLPLELIAERDALNLMEELEKKYRALSTSLTDYQGVVARLGRLAGSDGPHAQSVVSIVWNNVESLSIFNNIDPNTRNREELFNALLKVRVPVCPDVNKN